ncbi:MULTISPECIES: dihydropteroate synthase [unclassified Streptomyces]|uniref:dihydropteroate synthase n=1 Tax=unclassified Streptomyces TaxID=2593676 RepID=UPI000ABD6443|nr:MULTISPECIES: dihydropteroate synthase [unclassified Streptomyces]
MTGPVRTPAPAGTVTAGGPARPLVMGVLNVTPDSFSDGGAHRTAADAVRHGRALAAAGADWVDVGGESTRPGARRPSPATELARVLPVVRELSRLGVAVSVDTMRAEVARRAVDAGAGMVNDVSGGLADPAMFSVVAGLGVPYVLTHWRSGAVQEHRRETYADVVREVTAELRDRVRGALDAGIDEHRLVVDPGIGFSKGTAQSWSLLRGIEAVRALGRPVLVGVSRKRLLTDVCGREAGPADRDLATAVVGALLAARGADLLRVHDVAGTVVALRVEQRLRGG